MQNGSMGGWVDRLPDGWIDGWISRFILLYGSRSFHIPHTCMIVTMNVSVPISYHFSPVSVSELIRSYAHQLIRATASTGARYLDGVRK